MTVGQFDATRPSVCISSLGGFAEFRNSNQKTKKPRRLAASRSRAACVYGTRHAAAIDWPQLPKFKFPNHVSRARFVGTCPCNRQPSRPSGPCVYCQYLLKASHLRSMRVHRLLSVARTFRAFPISWSNETPTALLSQPGPWLPSWIVD